MSCKNISCLTVAEKAGRRSDFRYRDMMVIMQQQSIYLAKMAIPLCVVKIFKHLDFW